MPRRRGRRATLTGSSYTRAPVVGGSYATCPGCAGEFQVTQNGRMGRHGWRTYGREVGVYGQAWQTGACVGWRKRPLEQTDEDALALRKMHLDQAKRLDKGAETVEAGKGPTEYQYPTKYRAVASRAERAGYPVQTLGGGRRGSASFLITVEKGVSYSTGTGVPSFEWLRQQQIKALRDEAAAHRTVAAHLAKLINQFRALGATEVKQRVAKQTAANTKGPTIHMGAPWKGSRQTVPLCKQYGMRPSHAPTTTVQREVTCKACLKKLGAEKKAKRAAGGSASGVYEVQLKLKAPISPQELEARVARVRAGFERSGNYKGQVGRGDPVLSNLQVSYEHPWIRVRGTAEAHPDDSERTVASETKRAVEWVLYHGTYGSLDHVKSQFKAAKVEGGSRARRSPKRRRRR